MGDRGDRLSASKRLKICMLGTDGVPELTHVIQGDELCERSLVSDLIEVLPALGEDEWYVLQIHRDAQWVTLKCSNTVPHAYSLRAKILRAPPSSGARSSAAPAELESLQQELDN